MTGVREPRPSVRTALAVLALGILLALPAAIIVGVRALKTIGTSSISTPGVARRHLTAGRWFICQRTGTTSGGFGFTFTHNNAPTLQPDEVTVAGSDGNALPVSFVTVNETITEGSQIYTAVVQFDVVVSGTYTVSVETPDSQIIITRPLGETFRDVLGFVAVGAVGGVLIATGATMLVVGSVRRNRVPRSQLLAQSSFTSPAGWYQDPSYGGRLRWWDGSRWTDHFG